MVERLPGATEENINSSVKNLESVETSGLRSYLDRTDEELEVQVLQQQQASTDCQMFRSFEPCLSRILDECLSDLGESFRVTKRPVYRCSCDMERIWRTLRLLPKDDVRELVEAAGDIEVRVE